MTKMTLTDLLKIGESQSVEFKQSLSLQREALEALCGMLNSEGGRGLILFGVKPDNSICGIESGNMDSAQKSLVQTIQQKFDPKILCDIQILEYEGKYLLALQAKRSSNVAFHEYDGRAFIREGSRKRLLSYEEKQNLTSRRNRDRHQGPWKCEKCGSI